MYVQCNIETRSRNHCCREKAIRFHIMTVCSLSYPPYNGHTPCYIVICCLPGSVTFLGGFAILRKATISFVVSVCTSVPMQQLGSHWTNFDKT